LAAPGATNGNCPRPSPPINRPCQRRTRSAAPAEVPAAYAKAHFDAERFWYRGNGSVDVGHDTAFDADKERDRNVVHYGHADAKQRCQG